MALSFNSYVRGTSLPSMFAGNDSVTNNSSRPTLYIYPSTIAYPSVCPTTLTAGSILTFSQLGNTSNNGTSWGASGSTISLSGSLTAAASAAGTLSWWLLLGPSNIYSMCGDSISTPGGGGVVIVSTLTPSNGTSVTLTNFSYSIV
jgi:hypothetical protein